MSDLFGKETKFRPGNFVTSDYMILISQGGQGATGQTGVEYLIQQVSFQFNQPLNRIYEIGSSYVYFAPGRAVGSIQLGRIVGRYPITSVLGPTKQGLWVTSGDVNSHVLNFFKQGGNDDAYHLRYVMNGAVVEGYSVQTDANGLLVQENVSMQFAGLDFGQ